MQYRPRPVSDHSLMTTNLKKPTKAVESGDILSGDSVRSAAIESTISGDGGVNVFDVLQGPTEGSLTVSVGCGDEYGGIAILPLEETVKIEPAPNIDTRDSRPLPEWGGEGIKLQDGIPQRGDITEISEAISATTALSRTYEVFDSVEAPGGTIVYALGNLSSYRGICIADRESNPTRIVPGEQD